MVKKPITLRHLKVNVVTLIYLKLYISKTVQDIELVSMAHL